MPAHPECTLYIEDVGQEQWDAEEIIERIVEKRNVMKCRAADEVAIGEIEEECRQRNWVQMIGEGAPLIRTIGSEG